MISPCLEPPPSLPPTCADFNAQDVEVIATGLTVNSSTLGQAFHALGSTVTAGATFTFNSYATQP